MRYVSHFIIFNRLILFRYVVYDKLRHKQCQVSDLVLGNNYYFRVRAMNEVGIGDAAPTKDSADIPKESKYFIQP